MAVKKLIIDGIKVNFDERALKDYRFTKVLLKGQQIQKKSEELKEGEELSTEDLLEQGNLTMQMVDILLGKDQDKVLEQFAKMNDGYVDSEKLFKWVGKLIEKANVGKK